MRWAILAIIAALVLTSCSYSQDKEKEINVGLSDEFWLVRNQTALVNGENLSIQLTKIVYNPCTQKDSCLWSGEGSLITITKDGIANYTGLALGGIESIKMLDYRIILEDLNQYRAKFRIDKLVEDYS